jgi:predicted membrane protein (TIGR00267 family)
MAERAERKRDLGKLETAMLADLEDTRYARASRLANLVIALVDRIGPALCALVLILPFALVPHVSLETAFYASLSLGLAILFLLGAFLARISEERPVVTGLQMIGVGIITILLVSLLLH